jgi:uncharacterized membrane protein
MTDMMTSESGFSWGWVIFLILILWFFVGGGFGGFGFGGYGRGSNAVSYGLGDIAGLLQAYNSNAAHGDSNCEVERRALVTASETNYRIIDEAQQTRAIVEASALATQNKIDSYAMQDLRDQLSEARRENSMLQNQLYSDSKFNAVQAQLANITSRMALKPEVYSAGAVCPNAAVINGLGINSYPFPYGNCGCNGNVLS